ANNPTARFAGAASGRVTTDGETVTVDVQMAANQLPPTTATLVNFYDANDFAFGVQQNGTIRDGTTSVFAGDFNFNREGARLDLLQGTVVTSFLGTGGSYEGDGREVAIPGIGPAGLQVTRKVYVPRDGYFARYLEVLSNPTADPITVDVRVDTHYRFFS